MIDISLWRASIGLWYYQICDNVIDKSLPALCRKGTRAKKQSSNEKHSQTNRNSTAVEQISSNEIPQSRANRRNRYSNPVVSNGQIPVLSTDGQKPVASTDEEKQVALSNGQTSVPSKEDQKPVASGNGQTQVSFSNSQKPVALSNSSTANTTMRYADWCGRVQTISLAVFLFLLLILSGDIELNPGPKTGNNTLY